MKRRLVVFAVLSLYTSMIFGQHLEQAALKNEKLLIRLVSKSRIPGLAVAIYFNNKPLWSSEYGYANLEHNIPVSDSSMFRIASVSKLLTGSLLLSLHKKKILHIDDAIADYLDSIPAAWESITIRQIAQHSSGIAHYEDVEDALDVQHYSNTREALNKFMRRPLAHPPDQGVTYSSYAYTVLAAVVEKACGMEFTEAMKKFLLTPLAMNHTRPDHQKQIIEGRTGFYQYNENGDVEHAPYIDLSGRWAGSGYLSTASDLAKFGAAHTWNSAFFTKSDLNLLTAPRKLNDTLSTKEGLGWGQRTGFEGELMYWGDGSTPGSKCGLLVYPEYNLSMAIVSNMRNAPIERGEFQVLATRIIATIKENTLREIEKKDIGVYDLDIDISGNPTLKGTLKLKDNQETLGSFNFHDIMEFPVLDAFWKDDKLWVLGIGGTQGPIRIGILPVVLNIQTSELSGKIFRINAAIKGRKE
ncbi:MAG: serine hydrolase domain-containing protein [Flavobacteriaceae bacterium]